MLSRLGHGRGEGRRIIDLDGTAALARVLDAVAVGLGLQLGGHPLAGIDPQLGGVDLLVAGRVLSIVGDGQNFVRQSVGLVLAGQT